MWREWIVENFDAISSSRYFHDGKVSLWQRIGSYRGVEETAWFARDDLVPFLMVGWSSLQWALERLFAKTWGVCSNWLGIGRRSARHTKVLAEHGAPLSPASFPPSKSRELRDLTRTTLIQERTRLINRVHKVLEDANLKLSSVLTDMLGQTGQRREWRQTAQRTYAQGQPLGQSDPGAGGPSRCENQAHVSERAVATDCCTTRRKARRRRGRS